jgi:hypothetical protein
MQVRASIKQLHFALALAFAAVPLAAIAQDAQSGHGQPEPQMKGIHWARDHAPPAGSSSTSPNLQWHGGPIMTDAKVVAIYWGTSWGNASFIGDKMSGLQAFYEGMNASTYANTTDEYSDSTGAITSAITYVGRITDLSAAPSNAGSRTSPILSEVCKALAATGVAPVADGYYPVYVDQRRGHAGYCAWHSAGSCNGVPVQFAFFFNLDGDAGCDPQDSSGLHSQGLAALANVSGHELSEARTDPRLNAWYDSSGSENADKCAWVFGTPLLTFSNTTEWKVQGNWSNAAYNKMIGYTNSAGQSGCIDGGKYQ